MVICLTILIITRKGPMKIFLCHYQSLDPLFVTFTKDLVYLVGSKYTTRCELILERLLFGHTFWV
jgi:hypothetical protein